MKGTGLGQNYLQTDAKLFPIKFNKINFEYLSVLVAVNFMRIFFQYCEAWFGLVGLR